MSRLKSKEAPKVKAVMQRNAKLWKRFAAFIGHHEQGPCHCKRCREVEEILRPPETYYETERVKAGGSEAFWRREVVPDLWAQEELLEKLNPQVLRELWSAELARERK